MIHARRDSWTEQFAHHFRPYAEQPHNGYIITVSLLYPDEQAALCIRIGDPRVGHHDDCVQTELYNLALTALTNELARPCVDSTVELIPWSWTAIAAGACAGFGVFILSGHEFWYAVAAGCAANLAAAGAETWRKWQEMKQARRQAVDITRQFHAQGNPPVPGEFYLPDPGRHSATLFLRRSQT